MLHIAICEDEELYLKAIQEHLQELAASERYEIFDIHLYSKSEEQKQLYAKDAPKFDVIFMDPPYSMGLERRILPNLIESSLVHDDTRIIVEASMEDDPIVLPPTCGWYVERVKEYKNNCHIFICRDKTAVAGEDE